MGGRSIGRTRYREDQELLGVRLVLFVCCEFCSFLGFGKGLKEGVTKVGVAGADRMVKVFVLPNSGICLFGLEEG